MWSLRVVRVGRRVRRRLFGKKLPHWAKDLLSLIRYINVLKLVPTVHALACQPNHFFKTLPTVLAGKKPYYVSPLSFVTNVAALQIAAYLLLFPDGSAVPKEAVVILNVVLALLTPVMAGCLCAVILVFWSVAKFGMPYNELLDEFCFNHHGALVPLDPRTYLHLDWSRFFWSMFYYYMYFYLLLGAVLVLTVVVSVAIVEPFPYPPSSWLKGRLAILYMAIVGLVSSLAGYWGIARPYAFALVRSSRFATPLMTKFLDVDAPRPISQRPPRA